MIKINKALVMLKEFSGRINSGMKNLNNRGMKTTIKINKALEMYRIEHLPEAARVDFIKRHLEYKEKHGMFRENKAHDWFNVFFYQWNDFDFENGIFLNPDSSRIFQILTFFMNNAEKYDFSDFWTHKRILNVGSHCGLEALIFTALGAKSVTCFDEHDKVLEVHQFLVDFFSIKNCQIFEENLYNIPKVITSKFDVVYMSGVIYHVSDPYRALRILYNVLEENGLMFLETLALTEGKGDERTIEYRGPSIPGRNWFVPSAKCCVQMTVDAGFDEVIPLGYWANDRFCLIAKKHKQKPAKMYAGVANSDELMKFDD